MTNGSAVGADPCPVSHAINNILPWINEQTETTAQVQQYSVSGPG